MQFLVSAGEASGDMYAAGVVSHLAKALPNLVYYGCAGPKLRQAGVKSVVDASQLAVVGLAEVVEHLPRIYGEYRKLITYTRQHRPVGALLTDSPDFHLRLARHLKRLQVPVFYLVAPQVWAWRQHRVKAISRLVDKLFCLFPFEEEWFRDRGVDATYIGHPLAHTLGNPVKPRSSRAEFLSLHGLPADQRLIVLLPGSRAGEACRHLPVLLEAVALLRQSQRLSVILATPQGFQTHAALKKFREPIESLAIKVIENETWDCIRHADLALAASGTVTIEAAVLGTPMVTFYKVAPLTWLAGRRLVKVPFLSMVNLVAGRAIVPELIQHEMTPEKIAAAAQALLENRRLTDAMRGELAEVRATLTRQGDPLQRAAEIIAAAIPRQRALSSHVF
ncbi:MAG TPA: lipid-A-disaccharide synthase [Bryobacteraceae bacterium]|nr:lipid-A-disaccharide synthase [Bryobacteraceae bacterium]